MMRMRGDAPVDRIHLPPRLPPFADSAAGCSSVAGSISSRRLARAAGRRQAHGTDASAAEPHALDDERTLKALAKLDDPLVAALGRGDIRLVRSAWLLAQPDDFRMPRRQELEACGVEPLLSGDEAVALMRKGRRVVGALTYGWNAAQNPDPTGRRLAAMRQALETHRHIKAFFWDFASLPQKPRSPDEDAAFARALGVMGDLYASAIGTTVLQIRETPLRPKEYDGAICLFGVTAGASEAAVRKALGRFGEVVSVTLGDEPPVVRFENHAAALDARSAGPIVGLCDGIEMLFNERSYDGRTGEEGLEDDTGRGWCTFESAVSSELLIRLDAYPKMRAALAKLPPKMLALSSALGGTAVDLTTERLDGRIERVVERIEKAVFTGKGDKPVVKALYLGYVERLATMLQGTLALASAGAAAEQVALPPLPSVAALATPQYGLSSGQLVLARGEGGAMQLGVVTADGLRAALIVSGDEVKLSFDGCSQAVLSWLPMPDEESLSWLQADVGVLRLVGAGLRAAHGQEALMAGKEMLAELRKAQAVVCRDAAEDLESRIDKMETEMLEQAGKSAQLLRDPVRACKQDLSKMLETCAAKVLCASGMLGLRRYAPEQLLSVQHNDAWVDAKVIEASASGHHRLRCGGQEITLPLHPWNHAPRELEALDFVVLLEWHMRVLRAQHGYLTDALSGKRLDVLEQCVAIDVTGNRSELQELKDAGGLSRWLLSLHADRGGGDAVDAFACALLTAGPAAGKTCLMSQIVMHVLNSSSGVVPILVKLQLLQQRLLAAEHANTFASAWNWIDAYLRIEHANQPTLYRMLRQALAARRTLLLLDGLDEGGVARERIERHLVEVLAMQGHVILATSRPAGVSEERFRRFVRLELSPLSEAQQQQAMEQRVGAEREAELMDYVRDRVPIDNDTKQRVTANPLMLSMVASIFELRQGIEMPQTMVELYSVATTAMLERAGAQDDSSLGTALLAIFFEAHSKEQRVITEAHLKAAAKKAGSNEGITLIKERVLQDRMPLLSLLQAEPLQMQAAHLSFQEYYALRAVCKCRWRLPTKPWQFGAFWANMVKMGGEMGAPFARGLLYAAGVEGKELNLAGKLNGDRPTVMSVIAQLTMTLEALNLSNNRLEPKEVVPISEALKLGSAVLTKLNVDNFELNIPQLRGTEPVETIELSKKGLGVASGIVIANLIEGNMVLTSLDLSVNALGVEGGKALADALSVNAVLASLDVGYNSLNEEAALAIVRAMLPRDKMTRLGLAGCGVGPTGAKEIAQYVLVSTRLANLNLARNTLGTKGCKAIAAAIMVHAVLANLNLEDNRIGPAGARAIVDAMKSSTAVLTSLDISRNQIGAEGANAFAEVLSSGTAVLTDLNLGNNSIGPDGGKAIAEALKSGTTVLTNLNLKGNDLGPNGTTAIAEALTVNVVLTGLNLQDNFLGLEGGKALARALEINAVLINLNLKHNELRCEGVKALVDVLKTGKTVLTDLNLGMNSLTNVGKDMTGIYAIAEALKSGTMVLKSIDLSQNALTKYGKDMDGIIALAQALKFNAVLEMINLSYNSLDTKAGKAIAKALAGNAVLTDLNLANNRLDDEAGKALAEALKGNAVMKTLDVRFNVLWDEGKGALCKAMKRRDGFKLLL